MRKTQATLYKIGKIINLVLLGLYALSFLIALIVLIVRAVGGYDVISEISTMITMTIFAAFVIVLMILVGKFSEEALKAPVDALAPTILLMVFGVLSGNLLFTVGGVFGIIGAAQENNAKEKESDVEKVE